MPGCTHGLGGRTRKRKPAGKQCGVGGKELAIWELVVPERTTRDSKKKGNASRGGWELGKNTKGKREEFKNSMTEMVKETCDFVQFGPAVSRWTILETAARLSSANKRMRGSM